MFGPLNRINKIIIKTLNLSTKDLKRITEKLTENNKYRY